MKGNANKRNPLANAHAGSMSEAACSIAPTHIRNAVEITNNTISRTQDRLEALYSKLDCVLEYSRPEKDLEDSEQITGESELHTSVLRLNQRAEEIEEAINTIINRITL